MRQQWPHPLHGFPIAGFGSVAIGMMRRARAVSVMWGILEGEIASRKWNISMKKAPDLKSLGADERNRSGIGISGVKGHLASLQPALVAMRARSFTSALRRSETTDQVCTRRFEMFINFSRVSLPLRIAERISSSSCLVICNHLLASAKRLNFTRGPLTES